MLRVIGQKILHIIPVLLIVSLATLLMLDAIPGDPAYAILGDQATPEQVELIHKELGLDRSFVVRYFDWLGSVFTGDFGTSIRTNEDVLDAIRQRLPVTLEIAILAQIIALAVAIPAGIYAAYRADRTFDKLASVGASLLISSPHFLSGLFLAYFFAVKYQIFPVTGWEALSDGIGQNLKHAFLPSLTLALGEIAVFMRLLRADMIATLQEDFILAARAKGMPTRRILLRHALRPSSFSLLTLAGLSLGRLIGGAVIAESLFALPGVGQLLIQSIITKDFVMVQGVVMFVAVSYVLLNALVDVGYAFLDPRVRAGRA